MLVIPMSIAPFGSDEHLLKFAKWFFRNRLETFRKDIDICMTPNSRGQHAIPFVALRPERRARSAPASRNMTDDDHNLDDLKDRLSRGFGVQVREDLQVRAEIVIQPEEGRWVFTPNELSDLAEGLRSVLLKSKPEGGWPFRLTLKQYVGLFDHAIPDGHNYSE